MGVYAEVRDFVLAHRALLGEFPDLDIEPPQLPDRRIRALRGSQLVHDVYFRWEFLDDHEDPIAFLKRWGLPRRMRDNGTTPVWVGTAGLSRSPPSPAP